MASKATKRRYPDEVEEAKPRQRRRRTAFSDDQLNRLEEAFQEERFPGITTRTKLACELGIGEDRIQVWFQNRRARWRKREIKNKPAPHQSGMINSRVPQGPYQIFPHQTVFPPVHNPHETTVTWSLPAPFVTSTATYGFSPQVPGLSPSLPMTSAQRQYFSSNSGAGATQPLAFPYSLHQANATVNPMMSAAAVSRPMSVSSQSCGVERLSSDEYIAAVTLVNAFKREL